MLKSPSISLRLRPTPVAVIGLCCTTMGNAADMEQVTRSAEELANKAASSVSSGELFVWLATGLLIGSLVGTLATRRDAGFGFFGNLGIGLLGAILGGFVCEKTGLNFGLGDLVLSYDSLLAAAIGALVVVLTLAFVKNRYLRARTPAHTKKKD